MYFNSAVVNGPLRPLPSSATVSGLVAKVIRVLMPALSWARPWPTLVEREVPIARARLPLRS
jgi:hypothetical protein